MKTLPRAQVCVAIVTYNSEQYIRKCLNAVLEQTGPAIEVVVVDNASTDRTRTFLRRYKSRVRVLFNDRNVGFAAAQNQAIGAGLAEWVLTLNPDVLVLPDFIETLWKAGEADRSVGTVCGKLLSIGPGFRKLAEQRIDSTGMYFTPAMRHFDRGWHESDDQRFDSMEYVFGASAAAALYRREMIEDVSVDGNFFDPDFFCYREDADVAWRALLMGWRCLYAPAAASYHVRSMVPGNRASVPAVINMHSVKNRFLMRIKNATGGVYRHYWLPMTLRDLVVVGGAVLAEPASVAAFWHLAKCLPKALRERREIMRRRKLSDRELADWFGFHPVSQPVGESELEPAYASAHELGYSVSR